MNYLYFILRYLILLQNFMKIHNLAFIDTETTGTNPDKHEIIELALIVAKQIERPGKGPKIEILGEYEWKIKPERIEDAEDQALRINGYNETDWMFAIDLKSAISLNWHACLYLWA